jgi:L-asparaginase
MARAIRLVAALPFFAIGLSAATVSVARSTSEDGRPIVRLVATGGTISSRGATRLTADELVASIPGLKEAVVPEAEQFANVDSNELTPDEWLRLSRRLNELFALRRDLAGIVVTMGTDTLEELSYFLHLTVRDTRPVVVVGAMRSPDALGTDGPANLLSGFRVAADASARELGTLVVMNDEINSAREVTKSDVRRLETFQTRGYGVLGVVDPDRVAWYRKPLRRSGAASEFDVSSMSGLPRVDIVLSYAGAPAGPIKAAVDEGARGIVLASAAFGIGAQQQEGVRYALTMKVPVVVASRTGSGRIDYETSAFDPWRRSLVAAEDLSPLKARVLLMLALASSSSRDELQRMFQEY